MPQTQCLALSKRALLTSNLNEPSRNKNACGDGCVGTPGDAGLSPSEQLQAVGHPPTHQRHRGAADRAPPTPNATPQQDAAQPTLHPLPAAGSVFWSEGFLSYRPRWQEGPPAQLAKLKLRAIGVIDGCWELKMGAKCWGLRLTSLRRQRRRLRLGPAPFIFLQCASYESRDPAATSLLQKCKRKGTIPCTPQVPRGAGGLLPCSAPCLGAWRLYILWGCAAPSSRKLVDTGSMK